MIIRKIDHRAPALMDQLLAVWESSVRATHDFLSESEILRIKGYVPQALTGVAALYGAFDNAGEPLAFMGAQDGVLEMLFVRADCRGQGIGRALAKQAVQDCGVREVTVNEQNPQARDFYEHLGFETYRRSETDAAGDPYPILYMRLNL